jgi:hypothetical protein
MTATLPAKTAIRALVLDSAEFAWNEYGCLNLGEFGREYTDLLNQAGALLMQQALITAWACRGRLVHLVDAGTFTAAPGADSDPSDDTYHQVWQEAADAIDPDALLTATDLVSEYTARYQD